MRRFEQENIVSLDTAEVMITEALNPTLAEKNLREIIDLCTKNNNNRLFIMAAGNINSFFYEIRKQLEEEGIWPDNLIFCGIGLPDSRPPVQVEAILKGGKKVLIYKDGEFVL